MSLSSGFPVSRGGIRKPPDAGAKEGSNAGFDRDLTFFGEAFYRDALPFTDSLRKAFQYASPRVRDREKQEKVQPSQPQSYFGLLLEDRLPALMTRPPRYLGSPR
jgi:hypothetical protein